MFSLKNHSTFRIDVSAHELIEINTTEDLRNLIISEIYKKNPNRLIVGWGSNILFTQDFDGLIIFNNLKGINTIKELNNSITLSISSGENRNNFVMWSVQQWYAGLENLVAIPGTVWAAPVQNIGAYGTEVRDIIREVKGIDMNSGEEKIYTNEQCEFWYRDSIFKHTLGQDFFITEVVIQLIKANQHIYHPRIQYSGIEEELLHQWRDGWSYLTPLQVANAIKNIRASKLPDRTKIGTCGSFFANPIISTHQYETLKTKFPDLIGHTTGTNTIKLSAGQLIELCGLKWYRDGDAWVYEKHALVLVNYWNATGPQMKNLISMIQSKVKEKFGIDIIPEVNII